MTAAEFTTEISKINLSVVYFTNSYCKIQDDDGQWIPFSLWEDQTKVLRVFATNKQVVALKARQIGMTWLALAYALHVMITKPGVTVLLFSLRQDEAIELLRRLTGMYRHLPDWLQFENTQNGNKTSFELPNGSRALAFPTGTGDSYTAKLAIIDEADLLGNDLATMINSVKPTIDAGGQLFLVSKSNKKTSDSPFKRIYRAARNQENGWRAVFLPWYSRPGRTKEWYEHTKRSDMATNGTYDYLFENYPATDSEALAPGSSDKRYPHQWIEACFRPLQPNRDQPPHLSHIIGLKVYRDPVVYRDYVLGIDVAEGNPESDPSALVMLDKLSGEEVLSLEGKIAVTRLAQFALAISKTYNNAAALVERNNHGHEFITYWNYNREYQPLLDGHDSRPGWLNGNRALKTRLGDSAADQFRDGLVMLHTQKVVDQLMLLDGEKIAVPEDEGHDDLAIACLLAMLASIISTHSCRNGGVQDYSLEAPPGNVFGVPIGRGTPYNIKFR